jgi:hypothetical protein
VFLAVDWQRLDQHGAGGSSARSPAALEAAETVAPLHAQARIYHRIGCRGSLQAPGSADERASSDRMTDCGVLLFRIADRGRLDSQTFSPAMALNATSQPTVVDKLIFMDNQSQEMLTASHVQRAVRVTKILDVASM